MFWFFLLSSGAAYSPAPVSGATPGGRKNVSDRAQRPPDVAQEAPPAADAPRRHGQVVFLLHGICKSSYDMAFIALTLRRAGYEVVNWQYPSRKYDLEKLAGKLEEAVKPYADRQVHFVTHSMGGIVVRTYLNTYKPGNVGRMVMIAPPNQGAFLANLLGDWMVYRLVFGPAGQQLRQGAPGGCAEAGVPGCEFGVIAGGTGDSHGMNPIIPGDNDGTVAVADTRLEGMQDFLLVPYGHTYIQFMPRTVQNVMHFLETGHFYETRHGKLTEDGAGQASAEIDNADQKAHASSSSAP